MTEKVPEISAKCNNSPFLYFTKSTKNHKPTSTWPNTILLPEAHLPLKPDPFTPTLPGQPTNKTTVKQS